jgi:hypothetical protein
LQESTVFSGQPKPLNDYFFHVRHFHELLKVLCAIHSRTYSFQIGLYLHSFLTTVL